VLRQAYILAGEAVGATTARRATVGRIRSRFEAYFAAATGGRGRALTQLQ
jgi:hypothetical protein